jgi:hypothetical protein
MPPVATARGTPSGIKLDDGFRTLVTFASNPTISFWEKAVTPPGLDGGDAVETTTMHNLTYRTMSPRHLKTMTSTTMTAAYDPAVYTSIVALINVKTTVTVTFPDGSTLAFFGFLQKFDPGELKEGDQPTASITFTPTNQDPTTGVEAAPVLVSVAGT